MPVARRETSERRVIAHVDMDCFYVQVEQRKQPELRGQPTAVVQYNSWKGGGLIAVGYEARKFGVKRSMRGDEAKQVCPEIQLVRVPVARGKADLSKYRNAGSEVVAILSQKGRCERASIDEVYLDLTDAAEKMLSETPPEKLEEIDEEVIKSHVLGLSMEGIDVREAVKEWICRRNADHRDKLLACGAFIVAELRLQVLKETQFSCSAGIAHNKMLAKLASGMNKPAQQTIVPLSSVSGLLKSLPIKKMKQLGGKLGSSLQSDLGVNTVGDLLQFSEERLQDRYGINTGTWLWNIARGINGDDVEGRVLPMSHGTGKNFPGVRSLKTITTVEFWLNKFSEELSERLQNDMEQNKRIAHTLTLHAKAYKSNDSDVQKKFPSKSCPLRYGVAKIQEDALSLFQAALREYLEPYSKTQGNQCSGWGINNLTLSASKIIDIPSGIRSIMKYFKSQDQLDTSSKELNSKGIHEAASLSPSGYESFSGPQSPEPQLEYYEEDKRTNYAMPSHLEDERNMCEVKNLSCSSSKHAQDNFSVETSTLSTTGSESSLVVKKAEQQLELVKEETRIKNIMDDVKPREQKRNTLKEKGTSSILRFFQSQNCSSIQEPKQELGSAMHETKPSFLSGEAPQDTMFVDNTTSSGVHSVSQTEERMNAWSYKIDEIDPTVVDELPPEIQEEVRAWVRPHKRANIVKRGSSIAHYFQPDKKP